LAQAEAVATIFSPFGEVGDASHPRTVECYNPISSQHQSSERNMNDERYFDLNIVVILDAWSPRHGVRELIANALDEQALTSTAEPTVERSSDGWVIKDFGRGIEYCHLTQDENPEKLSNPEKVIGKFGVGLKDAIAVLHRHRVEVEIRSSHAVITFTERAKHGFADVPTLHAVIGPPANREMIGTEVHVRNIPNDEVLEAKRLFLRFSGDQVIDATQYGQIIRRPTRGLARIYVNGVVVAEDAGFAFSYNITSLNAAMRKALNRERTNVGRTAFAERVKAMLLSSTSSVVAEILADEIARLEKGDTHDEVKWADVTIHACKILNATGSAVFASSADLLDSASAVDHARADGNRIVVVPENIRKMLSGESDAAGNPVRSLDVFLEEWSESFTFDFVAESDLSRSEAEIFAKRDAIAQLVGGLPAVVRKVVVSATMRPDIYGDDDVRGIWEPANNRIIIRRAQLRSVAAFSATLIHEITHAQSGCSDVTRKFESALTDAIGMIASKALGMSSMQEKSAKEKSRPPIKRRGASESAKSTRRSSRKR
jgi:hypothetical protein